MTINSAYGKNLNGNGVALDSREVIKSGSQLSGSLSSTIEYYLDGTIDLSTVEIEVPLGGLTFTGPGPQLSGLFSTEDNHNMFTSPVGGCGSVTITGASIRTEGTSSKVYDLVGATGMEVLTLTNVVYFDNTSLGKIDNFRQGIERAVIRLGGTPELELDGTWIGGFVGSSSATIGLADGAYTLFKAGPTFLMNGRFKNDFDVDLPTSASLLDFSSSNFVNSSLLQLNAAVVKRNGVSDASDPNLTPNITASDLKSYWKNNVGICNTHVGGLVSIDTRISTTFSAQDTYTDLLGGTAATDLAHFDSPANGQLRHIGDDPIEYVLFTQYTIAGPANEEMTIKFVKWDDSASSFVDIGIPVTENVNNAIGGVDAGKFSMSAFVTLEKNDYVKLQISNNDPGFADAAAEIGSFFTVQERA